MTYFTVTSSSCQNYFKMPVRRVPVTYFIVTGRGCQNDFKMPVRRVPVTYFIVTGGGCQNHFKMPVRRALMTLCFTVTGSEPVTTICFIITGSDCEEDYDACDESPCDSYQNCTDRTAEEQGDSDVGYNCTGCPEGFDTDPDDSTRFCIKYFHGLF